MDTVKSEFRTFTRVSMDVSKAPVKLLVLTSLPELVSLDAFRCQLMVSIATLPVVWQGKSLHAVHSDYQFAIDCPSHKIFHGMVLLSPS